MDGGRRLLQSVNGLDPALAAPRAVFLGAPSGAIFEKAGPVKFNMSRGNFASRQRKRQNEDKARKFLDILTMRGVGLGLTLCLFMAVGAYGVGANGQYAEFVRHYGRPRDMLARAIGFGVGAVTILGQNGLDDQKILSTAGVDPRQSLMFLDAADMRARLMALPLVKNANVRKFFPNRLVIEITERQPFGLWQKDGVVSIIAGDGAPIDELRDAKFAKLPFVVGEGANLRVDEFVGLLDAAGDLREKIRAGMLVSQRRWTLKMNSGVEVMLPETDPKAAVRQLAQLERDGHVIEKDVVSLDLRIPGKLYVRLTEEAAAAREAAAKAHGRGAHT
jgi:cell division protein FtsQ